MPKEKSSKSSLLKQWIGDDGNFTTDGKIIFCQPCAKEINTSKKFHLDQHKATELHQRNLKKSSQSQPLISLAIQETTTDKEFSDDLCDAMVHANIPWKKLNNPAFHQFLTKYTKRRIPNESTLRKIYLSRCFEKRLDEVKTELGNNFFWVSVDETTDRCGRYVANVVIGKLSTDPSPPYLIACKELEKTNHSTIARVVRDAIRRIWLSEENDERFLLLVTDAAAYMLKAGQDLKVFYPNMIHLTCMAHGVHRVVEHIRTKFPQVNKLISAGKKVFLKAPSRVVKFKECLPATPLPPQPVITRWGTWLNAAMYYAENLDGIKRVLQEFDETDAAAIREANTVLSDATLIGDLAFIKCNFDKLSAAITALETQNLLLVKAVDIVKEVESRLNEVPGTIGKDIAKKMEAVLQRNPGWKKIDEIAGVLRGGGELNLVDMNPSQLSAMKYCPITSCEVERSFSRYKSILVENRTNFTMENLEKHLFVYCNLVKDE